MEITWRRQLEIIDELQLASRYFQRLSMEIDRDESLRLPGDEWQMAQHIYESILLLQWRLESFGRIVKQIPPQPSTFEQALTQHALIQLASNHVAHSESE